ncbi:amidohydrolase family protein [Pseudarthrobacter psychrotolerans]|uniref:Amidohydrolase family protein n=1 Tax=Pseudarthrobacter psychrotolerans TaxID=2697569 RepID=A0A6P1NN87_9MICC|nr:amidohydrolase [Pseudarthrobacter psychrotolerans]QHK20553.1 amidohydrolase family protein [Pseudarthrobacter psychrotolerans]
MAATIITNGIIRTDAFAEPVEALTVSRGRILAAGSRDEAEAVAGSGAQVHDLKGASVIPGLVESHVHPIFYGLTRNWADCRSPLNRDIADVQKTLRATLRNLTGNAWVRGWGYDDTLLFENRHPTRDDLDAVSTDVPVIVSHISGHFVVANTKAMEVAGVTEDMSDPAEGRLVRDGNGKLTGLMWELGAVNLIMDAAPKPRESELQDAAVHALSTAASRGMTSVHDLGIGLMGGAMELETWEHLADADRIPIRVIGYLRGDYATDLLDARPNLFTAGPRGNFDLVGAKYWADGSIQGLSAALTQPYSCAQESCGDLLFEFNHLVNLVKTIDAAGGQCAVHANGDRAIRAVVDAFAEVKKDGGRSDSRHRIEHLQMASANDIEDLIAAGGAASVFANHIYYWGDRHRDIFIGEDRASRIEPLADAVSKGLHFGLHSDCPITPMDSLRTLWTAVTRETSSGATLGPEQRLTPAQALHSLTADSAWLAGAEGTRGTLLPGMDADLAVLDRDILHSNSAELADVGVVGTMVGGEWVFTA